MSIPCEYRKLGYGFELPPGYTECEYLESTGTQYIDTGHYATHLSGVHIRYAYLRKGNGAVLGGRKDGSYSNANEAFAFITTNNGGGIGDIIFIGQNRAYIADQAGRGVQGYIYDAKVNVDVDQKVYLNGAYYFQGSTTAQFTQTVPTLMFAGRPTYSQIGKGTVAIYSCTIYSNTVPIMNFVPCLDVNSIPCMYDTIGRKPYYNVGTGTFNYKTKPAPFPYGYTELEYIESTGTQWIDTELPAQINVKFQCKVQFPDGYNEHYFSALRVNSNNTRYYLLNADATSSSRVGLVCTKYEWGHAASMNKKDGVSTPVEVESYIGDTSCYIKVDSNLYSADNLATGVPTSKTIPLFGGKVNNSDVVNYFSPRSLLWYARLSVNDVAVRDLVPYLDSYGVPCMVDILTGKTFYNQGTGTFKYKLK